MGSGGARKSSKWAREAVCTIATDVFLTPPKTGDFTRCRFYRQGRGMRGAPNWLLTHFWGLLAASRGLEAGGERRRV